MNRQVRIGIDLGGTKIEGIALNGSGNELGRLRLPTPQGDYEATLLTIKTIVDHLESGRPLQSTIGIGIPGIVSPATGLVKNANSVCLIGRPLHKDLETLLHRPVRLENDANCFAMSEAADGAAQGASIVFGVILGTGCGGGIVVNGQVLSGTNAIAGEWGHNPLPWPEDDERPGPPCYCGKRGCIETFLSGPGFTRDFSSISRETLSPKEIVQRSETGNPEACQALKRYEQRLAKSLATIINVIDPEVIVLGGGMSNIRCLYKSIPTLLPAWVFSDHLTTRIVPANHGDSSGVRGAAWLWPVSEN